MILRSRVTVEIRAECTDLLLLEFASAMLCLCRFVSFAYNLPVLGDDDSDDITDL